MTSDQAGPPGLPRLLIEGAISLGDHLAIRGPLSPSPDLIEEVRIAGLRGRGGAGFPTAIKLAAVHDRRRRRKIVVVNGAEGEPLSQKDRTLLTRSPHLVLDGAVAGALAVKAKRVIVALKHELPQVVAAIDLAISERRGKDPVSIEVATVPDRYISGQETALVNWLTNHLALPTVMPPRPTDEGVFGLPTLLDNVETMANLGLIARHGGDWWKAIGTEDEPGSILLTIQGAVDRPGIVEVAGGTPLRSVLESAGLQSFGGLLIGGYFGGWIAPDRIDAITVSRSSLQSAGAPLGCGVIGVLPADICPIAETARIARWLAGQSAGQCGPCTFGLPALAEAMEDLTNARTTKRDQGRSARRALQLASNRAAVIKGRGACRMPDGAAQFVEAALVAFAQHIAVHERGDCGLERNRAAFPTPTAKH
jgi:NADH:ubiquinone oxidoreductase subunit F (NADH-binding)